MAVALHMPDEAASLAPGPGIGPQQDTEKLLPGPQFEGLQEGRCGKVNVILAIAHVGTELAELCPCVCLVLAGQQERGCQEILQETAAFQSSLKHSCVICTCGSAKFPGACTHCLCMSNQNHHNLQPWAVVRASCRMLDGVSSHRMGDRLKLARK